MISFPALFFTCLIISISGAFAKPLVPSVRKLWFQYVLNNTADVLSVSKTSKGGEMKAKFYKYVRYLSAISKQNSLELNVGFIGACDGTFDELFESNFLVFDHWRGLFVEPLQMNVNDLNATLTSKNALKRSHIFQVAIVKSCPGQFIKMERPIAEELMRTKNKSAPHWYRRQVAQVQTWKTLKGEWMYETVPCMNASNVFAEARRLQ